MFHLCRAMLVSHRSRPGLERGHIDWLPAHDHVLAFVHDPRVEHGPACLSAFNASSRPARYTLPAMMKPMLDASHPLPSGTCVGQTLELPPYSAAFATL